VTLHQVFGTRARWWHENPRPTWSAARHSQMLTRRARAASTKSLARSAASAAGLNRSSTSASAGKSSSVSSVLAACSTRPGTEREANAAPGGLSSEVRLAADQVIQLVRGAQAEDGYLNSYCQVVAPERRWQELDTGHVLYAGG